MCLFLAQNTGYTSLNTMNEESADIVQAFIRDARYLRNVIVVKNKEVIWRQISDMETRVVTITPELYISLKTRKLLHV